MADLARRSSPGYADELSALPSQPFAALEILRIVNNENTSAQQIGRIIDADPALAARVLRMANSPYYGLPRGIANPSQAVVLLGLTTVKALRWVPRVDCSLKVAPLGRPDCGRTRLTRAVAASTIAGEIGASQSEAFTAGLLANIGVSLLFKQDPKSYGEVLSLVAAEGISLEAAEQRLLGSTHVEAGARALDSWRFPSSFVRAVLMHHLPIDTVSDRLARIVIAAGAFARFVDTAFHEESTDVPLDVVAALGIGAGRIQRIADLITAKVDELAPTLGISPDRKREGGNLERDSDEQLAAVRSNVELTRTAQQLVLSSCLLEVTKLAGSRSSTREFCSSST